MPAWRTPLFRPEAWRPSSGSFSRTTTSSRPRATSSRARVSPTIPPPTTSTSAWRTAMGPLRFTGAWLKSRPNAPGLSPRRSLYYTPMRGGGRGLAAIAWLLAAWGAAAATPPRGLHYKSITTAATIDEQGELRVVEQQVVVLAGDAGPAERTFALPAGATLRVDGVDELDAA